MKKKILAALSAAMLAVTALGAPAFAAETKYKKGDINMDGKINVSDVLTLLGAYAEQWVNSDCGLTEEQIELATITGEVTWNYEETDYVTFGLLDVVMILRYITANIAEISVPDDIAEFAQQVKNGTLDWRA